MRKSRRINCDDDDHDVDDSRVDCLQKGFSSAESLPLIFSQRL